MSVLAPRVVLVHRRSELDELFERHATRGQVEFFLRGRGRSLAEVDTRHDAQEQALQAVSAAIPLDWRRGSVERGDLPRFLFAPGDIVVAVGQDGLVANVAKYVTGQLVVGVSPGPPGVLAQLTVEDAAVRLRRADLSRLGTVQARVTVEARSDDGQVLRALNEIYIGHASHQSARYRLELPAGQAEDQSSSGVLVSTGTGATGWCASVLAAHASPLRPPMPTEASLTWMVREAWPSPWTGTSLAEGLLAEGETLSVSCRTDRLVVFGDGIEQDFLPLSWGQVVHIGLAQTRLHLVV